ncbi:MAG TPA: FtsX-like permease family protein, partial [Limnochordia bacterium]|nr:FtsX-like permease family protein [Limnochordia bacterium]
PGALHDLGDDGALIAADYAVKNHLSVGDALQIGAHSYVLRGLIDTEPDARLDLFALGPRVMLSTAGLARAGLIVPGVAVSRAFLLKAPAGADLALAKTNLIGPFRNYQIRTFDDAQPQVRRLMDALTGFLSLIALLSLVVGGLGVANTVHVYIAESLDDIAVLGSLGASGRLVTAAYTGQVAAFALIGGLLGALLGYLVQWTLPGLFGPLLRLDVALSPSPGAALQGIAVGLVIGLAFAVAPLSRIRRIRPLLLLRRELVEGALQDGPSRRQSALQLILTALLLWALFAWVSGLPQLSAAFVAGAGAALGLLRLAAGLLMRALARLPAARRIAWRHGLGNLVRPGSQASLVVSALGMGVAVVFSVYLLQANLLSGVRLASTKSLPNLVFFNIPPAQRGPLADRLASAAQTGGDAEVFGVADGAVDRINGKPVPDAGGANRRGRHAGLAVANALPLGYRAETGAWPQAVGGIAVSRAFADELGLKLGDTLSLRVEGRRLVATVRAVVAPPPGGLDTGLSVVLPAGALPDADLSYVGAVRTSDPDAVQAALGRAFPQVTAVNVTRVLAQVQRILSRIALVIRFVGGTTIAGGLIIMAGSIAATRRRRLRESVLLRTLGARARLLYSIYAVEYGSLGVMAAVIGTALAHAAAYAFFRGVIGLPFRPAPAAAVVAVAATLAVTLATGFLSSLGVLREKPLALLREP